MRHSQIPLTPSEFLEVLYEQIRLRKPPDSISYMIETHMSYLLRHGDPNPIKDILKALDVEKVRVPYHLLLILQLTAPHDTQERRDFKERVRAHLRPLFPSKYMRWMEEFDDNP